ncbi:hypothetical protein CPTAKMNP4_034 [Salmonella phage vB_SenM-AKM_NP4]|uniref:Uncharacterized protein n=2 Tax=Gelderlandvirus TaxID=1913653 RepID=M1EA90_BPS16|nr:hypothetical protein I133_gp237 [Salmonella phage vB_SenM-S16]YP_009154749.1 hypothetical protein STP4a_030 [Salmonella phage STP4-a]UFK27158.1 hypothetical protein LG358_00137 [Escherichia phage UoN_LG358_1]WDR21700.1 hypothetical protein PJM34_0032 [Salmonella phage vB_SenM_UTK0003]WLI71659.1 hypothetical protein CPTAKMNP4_034 [Salmonella phage vB_SenM-AKM_NP4]AEO97021.1 hypothetical protein [Salmonella phage vB_SenM-S16]AKO62383.1 hypothetical protein STP4a_030 [Salmonella phage STP4-a]
MIYVLIANRDRDGHEKFIVADESLQVCVDIWNSIDLSGWDYGTLVVLSNGKKISSARYLSVKKLTFEEAMKSLS